ncbi:MAG: hypothetical protein WB780_18170 [Candidatus Acidiferrales bacterium]
MSISRFRHLLSLAAILILAWQVVSIAAQTVAPSSDPYPMSKGTYWIYRGTVRWFNGREGGATTKVTWRTEVLKVIRRGAFVAAVIKGFPSDLDWSDGDPKQVESLLIRTGKDDYYLLGADEAQEGIKTLRDSNASVGGLLNADDLILRLPLKQGAKFCDADSMARDDDMYCWMASSVDLVSLSDVKGVPAGGHEAYELRYVTLPDDTTYTFVPGVGIVSYEYHHHGTVADTELKLAEFHLGSSN